MEVSEALEGYVVPLASLAVLWRYWEPLLNMLRVALHLARLQPHPRTCPSGLPLPAAPAAPPAVAAPSPPADPAPDLAAAATAAAAAAASSGLPREGLAQGEADPDDVAWVVLRRVGPLLAILLFTLMVYLVFLKEGNRIEREVMAEKRARRGSIASAAAGDVRGGEGMQAFAQHVRQGGSPLPPMSPLSDDGNRSTAASVQILSDTSMADLAQFGRHNSEGLRRLQTGYTSDIITESPWSSPRNSPRQRNRLAATVGSDDLALSGSSIGVRLGRPDALVLPHLSPERQPSPSPRIPAIATLPVEGAVAAPDEAGTVVGLGVRPRAQGGVLVGGRGGGGGAEGGVYFGSPPVLPCSPPCLSPRAVRWPASGGDVVREILGTPSGYADSPRQSRGCSSDRETRSSSKSEWHLEHLSNLQELADQLQRQLVRSEEHATDLDDRLRSAKEQLRHEQRGQRDVESLLRAKDQRLDLLNQKCAHLTTLATSQDTGHPHGALQHVCPGRSEAGTGLAPQCACRAWQPPTFTAVIGTSYRGQRPAVSSPPQRRTTPRKPGPGRSTGAFQLSPVKVTSSVTTSRTVRSPVSWGLRD